MHIAAAISNLNCYYSQALNLVEDIGEKLLHEKSPLWV